MGGVGTSIFGRPRRLPRDRRAAYPYTLIWEEPVFGCPWGEHDWAMDGTLVRGYDLMPLVAAGLAVVMAGVYVWLMGVQGDQPRSWFLGALLVGALLSAYGSRPQMPYRRPALLIAAVCLLGVGILGILSIGWPIVGAGALAMLSSAHSPQPDAE
jgi:hypothetical protein